MLLSDLPVLLQASAGLPPQQEKVDAVPQNTRPRRHIHIIDRRLDPDLAGSSERIELKFMQDAHILDSQSRGRDHCVLLPLYRDSTHQEY